MLGLTMSDEIEGLKTEIEAKVYVLTEAVQSAKVQGCTHVYIETDMAEALLSNYQQSILNEDVIEHNHN